MCNMYIIIDPTSPTWYSGMGWTGGMAVPAMGRWYNPMGSRCLMVQWDGMDRWDGCPSHGTVVHGNQIATVIVKSEWFNLRLLVTGLWLPF